MNFPLTPSACGLLPSPTRGEGDYGNNKAYFRQLFQNPADNKSMGAPNWKICGFSQKEIQYRQVWGGFLGNIEVVAAKTERALTRFVIAPTPQEQVKINDIVRSGLQKLGPFPKMDDLITHHIRGKEAAERQVLSPAHFVWNSLVGSAQHFIRGHIAYPISMARSHLLMPECLYAKPRQDLEKSENVNVPYYPTAQRDTDERVTWL